ncbi:ubiquitin carboxyl-terminal hydrolase-like isoform X2 [Schistocerca gregaria]|uniref:ubiquitin carboxyl-terminal hydrolase-like isoform X2 n=1 Tax=Schistocerca gregaria TaxID=7010 RepID=UPI00211E7140|nr:ubiquitin carboxyl-terminal hydrolase-like isoform X2 [Schistocerca gregaria]
MDLLVPLESDPDIFSELMHHLGVSSSANLRIMELYSTDEEALPNSNVLAVIVVFPGPSFESPTLEPSDDGKCVWFMKQYTRNVCGIIAKG